MTDKRIEQAYRIGQEQYAATGVDTEAAMKNLEAVPV